MFLNSPLDFFYAAHNQVASTVMDVTISLTLSVPASAQRCAVNGQLVSP